MAGDDKKVRATAASEAASGSRPRLALTGVAPVCAAGVGRAPFWRHLVSPPARGPAPFHEPAAEGLPFEPFPLFRPDWSQVEAALGGWGAADLPPDPEIRLAAAAARLAIEDAGLEEPIDAAALVVTCESPGMDRFLRGLFADFQERTSGRPAAGHEALAGRFYQTHKDAAYSTQSFLHLHLLARVLGIHGHTLFINNACASGLYALDAAALLLQAGKAGLAVVVAAESPRFPTKHLWFSEAGLASRHGELRPFDRDRCGLVLGEGSAAVVIEPLAGARARGARIYAEYLGGACNQEGWKVTLPNFAERYHERVIRDACEAAGIRPEDVDGIVAHGAGTSLSDAYEARGLAAVFGDWPERPAITALKGYFGHTLGASALLELVALLLAMEEGRLPAARGFENPDPKLKVRLAATCQDQPLRIAIKVANGFAGFNAAAAFGRV